MSLDLSPWLPAGVLTLVLLVAAARVRVLDRYVGRMWVGSLLLAAVTMCGLYVVIDMARRSDALLHAQGTPFVQMVWEYYSCRIPVFFSRLMPMICLAATIMTVVRLTKSNELAPMILAGRSVLRILFPAILGMAAMMAGSMALEEWVLPSVALQFQLTEARISKTKTEFEARKVLFEADGTVWSFGTYSKETREMTDVIVDRREADGRAWHCRAQMARWAEGATRGWLLSNGVEYTLDPYERVEGGMKPIETKERLVPSALSPDRIEEVGNPFLSITDVAAQVLSRPNEAGPLGQFHQKLVFPLFNLILPLLGLSIMLRREVRSLMLGFGICLVVGLVFFGVYIFFVNLGNKGALDPVAAVWAPVVLFSSASLWLLAEVRT